MHQGHTHPTDLMEPDLLCDIVLLASGVLILLTLIFVLGACVNHRGRPPVAFPAVYVFKAAEANQLGFLYRGRTRICFDDRINFCPRFELTLFIILATHTAASARHDGVK